MLLFALACSSEPTPSAEVDPVEDLGPIDGDTLVVAASFDPGNLNSIVAPYALSGYYIGATQLGLVERRVDTDGLLHVPGVAESWSWSEDGLTTTFILRDDIVFSDGHPLSAEDVAFTYELILDPEVASNWHALEKKLESVEVIDEHTVAFTWKQPGLHTNLMDEFRLGVLPKHVLAEADRGSLRGHEYSRNPLSTASWKLTAWDKEARLVLEPNGLVTGRPPARLDRVITKIIPEYATQLIELENGSVDMVFTVELADIPGIEADHPEIRLLREEASGMEYVGWNMKDPILEDARVRLALTHAIDVERLIEDAYSVDDRVFASPCHGTVTPSTGGWYNTDIERLAFDQQQSMALFDEAGWTDTDGDAIRDRDGQPLSITLVIQNSIPRSEKLAIRIQAMLREVGVDLQIQALEPNLFSSQARAHEFQAILWGFGANYKVDPTIQWHSTGQYNWMGFSDPEVDRLLEEAMSTSELSDAQAKVREVQAIVYEAQPATFLVWQDTVGAIHTRFEGVKQNPYTAFQELETWWVPASKQKYR